MNIASFISSKMWRRSENVAALEDQNALLRERLKKVESEIARISGHGVKDRYREHQESMLRPVRDMKDFIVANYEFRHNVVRDVYEYRRKGSEEWKLVDKRQLNSINCRVQDDGEIFCLSGYVRQRVESELARDYHPIREYLNKVRGRWDGKTDYVSELVRRITGTEYCQNMVHKWLRAVVMQWLGEDKEHANAVMLLLVSPMQGMQKSTFLHQLMPPELSDYYTDDFSLTSKGNAHRKMVEFAMISIDEFDKMPRRKMPELKSMMQTLKPSFIGAYKQNFNQLPRIASFVGTSNERHLLTDSTGSRRFLILEPEGMIKVDDINHEQLYAQLLYEIEVLHLPHWFSKEDEAEMERRNKSYYVLNDVERLFLQHFSIPKNRKEGKYMEGRDVMRELTKLSRKTMEGVSSNRFGRYMTRLGVKRVNRHDTVGYIVNVI